MNDIFKDIGTRWYMEIKRQHGENYVEAYLEALAELNNLHKNDLYGRLKPLQEVKDKYYVVAVVNKKCDCVHVGYTLSPYKYWITILKNNRFDSVKNIVVLEKDLDFKAANAMARQKKASLMHMTRKLKLDSILESTQ